MRCNGLLLALLGAICWLTTAAPGAFAQNARDNAATPDGPAPAAERALEEAALVRMTLDQFDSALASHDVGQLQAAGVKPASAKGWQRFFKSNPGARVKDNCPAYALYISGNTAYWACTETATIVSDGEPLVFTHLIRFTFTRKNGAWTISDRR